MGTISSNLALLAYDEREFETSYLYMKKAIAIRERILPNGHTHIKDSINGLNIIEAKLKNN